MMFKVIDHTTVEDNSDIRLKIASKMIDRDYPVAEIAQVTGLSINEVEELK